MSLSKLLKVKMIESNTFQSSSHHLNLNGSLFGGQILSQALNASCQTLPEKHYLSRIPHSLHAYFLLPGSNKHHITYEVDNMRDGRSFSVRNVVAKQNNSTIFNATISFQDFEQAKLQHSQDIDTNQLSKPSQQEIKIIKENHKINKIFNLDHELFHIIPTKYQQKTYFDGLAELEFWICNKENITDLSYYANFSILAAASDMGILFASIAPYYQEINLSKMHIASLSHSLWMHKFVDMNKWHLIKVKSHWADNNRGLVTAYIYNEKGSLVATASQEGLIRAL